MSYGFQLRGSHGLVQIDETYRNLFLVQTGAVWAGTRFDSFNTFCFADVDIAGTRPMLALRCDVTACVLSTFQVAANVWRFRLAVNGTSGAAVSFWAYDVLPGSTSQSHGLVVYNASGLKVFDSSHSPMKVVGFHQLTAHGWSGTPASFGYRGDRHHAVLMGSTTCYASAAAPQPNLFIQSYWLLGCSVSGQTFTANSHMVRESIESGGQTPYNSRGSLSLTILDVTA